MSEAGLSYCPCGRPYDTSIKHDPDRRRCDAKSSQVALIRAWLIEKKFLKPKKVEVVG